MASNRRTLKAYVRYDGTGKIIPGSLILSRIKPKVGNWVETVAYECCNELTTTTTTTTLDPNCIYFTIEATEGNLDFSFNIIVNNSGPDLTGTVTWGDGVVDMFTIPTDSSSNIPHTFSSIGSYSGTLCVSDPTIITKISSQFND